MSAQLTLPTLPPRRRRLTGTTLAVVLCLPALLPLLAIVVAVLDPAPEVWAHLMRHVLPQVIPNTLALVAGVALLSGLIGTTLAWLTVMCDFPGRRFFDWALLLPLALPAYVLAFVAVGFLDYAGPLQSWLREAFGTSRWFPPIRSMGGVIAVLALASYPYVYLLARSAFLTQGRSALEAAQTLGVGGTKGVWRVALPMARPWIAAGLALVCMETLADFGAVSVFNYDTFTTAIYRAWFGMFSVRAALQLSAVLMLFVLLAFALERRSRAEAMFTSGREADRVLQRRRLRGYRSGLAVVLATTTFLLAFALPMTQLVIWMVGHLSDLDQRYWGFVARSLLLASSAALVIVAAGLLLAYLQRREQSMLLKGVVRLATAGYAVPGTVLAVGTLVPIVMFNNQAQGLLRAWLGDGAPTLFLQGTLLTVLLAYLARFLAAGFNPIESGMQRITRNLDDAAVGLGVVGAALVRRVHVPLLRSSLATAAILVFVDVMKEMPITLITRPPGWDTLAVRVWEMTSEGEWERAALPAVAIVLVGLIPVALLTRRGAHVA